MRAITVRAGEGARLELVRREGALVANAPGDAGAAARAARVREALDEMVAVRAVTLDEEKAQGLQNPVLSLDVTPQEGRAFRVGFGAADVIDGVSVHFARRSDVAATFAVPQSAVKALVEALR